MPRCLDAWYVKYVKRLWRWRLCSYCHLHSSPFTPFISIPPTTSNTAPCFTTRVHHRFLSPAGSLLYLYLYLYMYMYMYLPLPPPVIPHSSPPQDIHNIMKKNIHDVLDRGERLEHVQRQSEHLVDKSKQFHWGAKKLNMQALWNKYWPRVALIAVVLVVLWYKFFWAWR
jgi:hypothetical protein